MARSYTHIKQYYEEMEQMHQEGHSCREIGEKFGFTKEQVKECLRRPRRKAQKEQERVPKRRGRQAKQIPTTLSALEKEVKQLRMENELLRDFLKAVVPFPVSWTVKMKKKQKETQDILSYHSQAAGCSDKARAKASGGRQPIEECGRTGL